MPDKAIEELEKKAEEAAEHLEEGDEEAAAAALDDLRGQLADLKAQLEQFRAETQGRFETMAEREHNHDLPMPLQRIADDWKEMELEEHSPQGTHHRYAKIGGGD